MQALVSAQSYAPVPAKQVPPEHVSPVVQILPSLQLAVLLVCVQAPVPGLQRPVVQGSPSAQSDAEFSKFTQAPVPGLQVSDVQGLVSAQIFGIPQTPFEHVAPGEHRALLFVHGAVFGVNTQPPHTAESQVSSVQALLSLQVFGVVNMHWQVSGSNSLTVQGSPSSRHVVASHALL